MTGRLEAADLAVVIPSGPGWERWDILQLTLRGLAQQTASGFETIVAVDGTSEPPAGLAEVRVVVNSHRGPGPRRNAGVEATRCEIVLLLGDDTIPTPELVALHLEHHRRRPEAEVAVLGHIGWHPQVARGRVERWLDWSKAQFDYPPHAVADAGFGRFYSSNLSIKRDFFLSVGGFDDDFAFGYEDTDLGLRLGQRGLRLEYEPAARAEHLHSYRWPAVERRFELVGEGEYLMTKKHPDFPPYFLNRILSRRRAPWWAPWPWLVDLVPEGSGRLRRELEARADAWYLARLTEPFLSGWKRAAERDGNLPHLRHVAHTNVAPDEPAVAEGREPRATRAEAVAASPGAPVPCR
jgi:glycosyltransferase involved in cell wall biosynthesis